MSPRCVVLACSSRALSLFGHYRLRMAVAHEDDLNRLCEFREFALAVSRTFRI